MKNKRLAKFGSITILIIASVCLFLAQSAFWINHSIFDQATFSNTVTTTILDEPNREAIATAVVDQALQNRPVLKRVVGTRAESLVSGLLGSDLSNQLVSTISNKAYAYTTAPNRKDIAIDLTAVKTPLATIVTLAENNGANIALDPQQIPDQIVLVQKDAFPDLSGAVKKMLWVGPLLWLSTIGLFALYIYLGRKVYAKRVYTVGAAISVVAILGILTRPFIPPTVAAAVPNITLRPVLESLASNFIAPFTTQMWYMLIATLLALIVFNQRFNILTGSRALLAKAGNLGSNLGNQPAKTTKPKAKKTTR